MRMLRATVSLLVLASAAGAQATAPSLWVRDTLQSSKLGEQRILYVATPANYTNNGERYPVLVLLDANDEPQFTAAVANINFLANRGAIPSLLIFGVTNG